MPSDTLEEEIDGVERPEQAFERREGLRSVVAAVSALPERQRDAIVLRELEGRSYDEIAAELGVTGGAVRQLLNRARTTLRAGATAITPMGLLLRIPLAADEPLADAHRRADRGARPGWARSPPRRRPARWWPARSSAASPRRPGQHGATRCPRRCAAPWPSAARSRSPPAAVRAATRRRAARRGRGRPRGGVRRDSGGDAAASDDGDELRPRPGGATAPAATTPAGPARAATTARAPAAPAPGRRRLLRPERQRLGPSDSSGRGSSGDAAPRLGQRLLGLGLLGLDAARARPARAPAAAGSGTSGSGSSDRSGSASGSG